MVAILRWSLAQVWLYTKTLSRNQKCSKIDFEIVYDDREFEIPSLRKWKDDLVDTLNIKFQIGWIESRKRLVEKVLPAVPNQLLYLDLKCLKFFKTCFLKIEFVGKEMFSFNYYLWCNRKYFVRKKNIGIIWKQIAMKI